MAESVGTIYYDVDANLDPLLGKMRQAEEALGGLSKGMGKVDGSARQMQQEFDKTERSASRLGGELNGLTRVIRGVVAAMALREAAQWVQQYQTMAERVRMATDSLDEFEMVQRRRHLPGAVRGPGVVHPHSGQPARHGVRDRASAGRYRLHVLRVRYQRDQR